MAMRVGYVHRPNARPIWRCSLSMKRNGLLPDPLLEGRRGESAMIREAFVPIARTDYLQTRWHSPAWLRPAGALVFCPAPFPGGARGGPFDFRPGAPVVRGGVFPRYFRAGEL